MNMTRCLDTFPFFRKKDIIQRAPGHALNENAREKKVLGELTNRTLKADELLLKIS